MRREIARLEKSQTPEDKKRMEETAKQIIDEVLAELKDAQRG